VKTKGQLAYLRKKGSQLQRLTADYLKKHLDDEAIDVQVQRFKDLGDVRGVKIHGQRVAIECKNLAKINVSMSLAEAEVERGNLDALAGVVVAKRHGRGAAGDQLVYMTLRDFAAILAGYRPEEDDDEQL
jgi:hypothetical protein